MPASSSANGLAYSRRMRSTVKCSWIHAARMALRAAASWRYPTEFYDFPIELKVVNKLFPYNRPEISGF